MTDLDHAASNETNTPRSVGRVSIRRILCFQKDALSVCWSLHEHCKSEEHSRKYNHGRATHTYILRSTYEGVAVRDELLHKGFENYAMPGGTTSRPFQEDIHRSGICGALFIDIVYIPVSAGLSPPQERYRSKARVSDTIMLIVVYAPPPFRTLEPRPGSRRLVSP